MPHKAVKAWMRPEDARRPHHWDGAGLEAQAVMPERPEEGGHCWDLRGP